MSPFDNALAIEQMEVAYTTLLQRPVAVSGEISTYAPPPLGLDGKEHPRIVSLGGDHTIVSTSSLQHHSLLTKAFHFLGSANPSVIEQNIWSCCSHPFRRSPGHLASFRLPRS